MFANTMADVASTPNSRTDRRVYGKSAPSEFLPDACAWL
jgi:hypothetical protein